MKIKELVAHGVMVVCLTAVAAICGRASLARGQEEAPPMPPEHGVRRLIILQRHDVEAGTQTAELRLNELGPGVTLQVSKAACDAEAAACNGKTACEEMIARLGAPDCANACANSCGAACTAACGEQLGKFVSTGCACTDSGECFCSADAGCGTDSKSACKCCSCGDKTALAALAAHAEHAVPHALGKGHEQCPFMDQMMKLVAEHAAAKAELATRREASEKFAQMLETMAELAAANAALHAKIESHEEQTKLTIKLAEFAAENARLKAHVELAGGRSEAGQHALTLTVENERLKERLAELERKQAESDATRSATRVRGEKRAR